MIDISFVEECREVAEAVRAIKDAEKMKRAKAYYTNVKINIANRANEGMRHYQFNLDGEDITEQLEKLLSDDGFQVDVEFLNLCGTIISKRVAVYW